MFPNDFLFHWVKFFCRFEIVLGMGLRWGGRVKGVLNNSLKLRVSTPHRLHPKRSIGTSGSLTWKIDQKRTMVRVGPREVGNTSLRVFTNPQVIRKTPIWSF